MANESRRQFWKRNSKVPGSLLKEGSKMYTQSKSKRTSSFHEFAKSTSDAWDIGDDEEEEFLSVASQSLNSKVAMATAAQVIQNHNKLKDQPGEIMNQSESIDEAKTNGKVVKSNSEVPLSKSSGVTLSRITLQKQQSLPFRPVIPLVARISDQNASGAPPMTIREKSRHEKFKQLLSSAHTDLGKFIKRQDLGEAYVLKNEDPPYFVT